MSTLLKWATLFLTLLISSYPLLAQETQEDILSGKWRGKLALQEQVFIAFGININKEAEQYSLTLDSPNQNMFGYTPTEFSILGNKVEFKDEDLKASFNGEINNGVLKGTFKQLKSISIELERLNDKALLQLKHEAPWYGELKLGKRNTLPLVLHIAVLNNGYLVTLDSPKQSAYGIPINEFDISSNEISFSADMIQASYEAKWEDAQWVGSFSQGKIYPLNFSREVKKINERN